jgi:L-threonylcarbamoyladenylate synthase
MLLDGAHPQAIDAAATALAGGALVGLPTETVYGLAADAEQDAAVRAIFTAKGRPADHPLIVHVADAAGAARYAAELPDFARALMDAFWPGPLTLILPRRPERATVAAGGQASVGLRCPAHPVAHALLKACATLGVHGLAAPSANRFGRVSPTTAAHVREEFGDALLVLDGGPCSVGVESTIVDCTRGAPVLLRPGRIGRKAVEAACGRTLRAPDALVQPAPRAPGTLTAHYAPRARVRLMDAAALQTGLDLLGAAAAHLAVWSRESLLCTSPSVELRPMPADAQAVEQQLFGMLREFDAHGVQLIWVQTPPADPAWDAVRDRLSRAAAAG